MTRNNRWLVLGVWSVSAGLSQFLWLNFAPILTTIESRYKVSESQASLLILVFPLVYVVLSLPSGAYIDRHGYRRGVGMGVLLMAFFSAVRIYEGSFALLLVAQIGIAIGQPFVINGISKLVLDWFTQDQAAIATGLGTVGMFVGMALGLAATPALVESIGFQGAMAAIALFSVASAIGFFFVVKSNPAGGGAKIHVPVEKFERLLKERNLLLLYALSFLGLGFFNGLTTWLELILAPSGINSSQAGIIGGVLILGGIFGAAIIPALSDHFKRRKPFLVGSIAVAALTLYPLCQGTKYGWLLSFGALQGFFFLPAFSLLLEMCADLVGEVHAAFATGILMLMGNAGGVVVVVAMEWIKGDSTGFTPAVHLLFVLLLASVVISLLLPETRKVESRLNR